jgi:hypothetical protein
MIAIPAYIDADTWQAFCDMRKGNKRAPFTDFAARLILKELMKFHAEGYDPNASLEQSIMNGWRGVFRSDMRQGLKPLTAPKQVETFKERDARLGRERWEQMTGQRHPENMRANPVDVYTLDLLEILQ